MQSSNGLRLLHYHKAEDTWEMCSTNACISFRAVEGAKQKQWHLKLMFDIDITVTKHFIIDTADRSFMLESATAAYVLEFPTSAALQQFATDYNSRLQ